MISKPDFTISKPDFTIVDAQVSFWGPNEHNQGGMGVAWQTKSDGFGPTFCIRKDGKLHCDNECMSREFILSVLKFVLDNTELDS